MIKENKRELLKVLPLIQSTDLKTQRQKIRRPWLNKLLERLRKERKLKLPKNKVIKRPLTSKNKQPKKLKTKLLKKPQKRQPQRRNDHGAYI